MQEICFYGERGIVNGLVLDIWEDLNLIRSVLQTIDWCKPSEHGWIDNLTRAVFLVEPGFYQFGQPDLLTICDIGDGSKRWLFIEVKSTPYHASSMSNQKGMTVNGYNSSINGQLSLDYRLALALAIHLTYKSISLLCNLTAKKCQAFLEHNFCFRRTSSYIN